MLPQEVLQKVQFLNKYSRYDWDINKRETWEETINRVMSYLKKTAGKALDKSTAKRIENALLSQRISPSMRLMATAGKGADRNQISIYNCSYLPLESSVDFRDLTMLLGHGTGVGFSVEDVYVSKWAKVPEAYLATYRFIVPDDIEGWALSIKMLIDNALDGFDTVFDYRLVRPKGSPLKTRGGYASGPEPLMAAHDAIRNIFSSRKGKKLRSLDLFDIANHVADAIVSGGVRRSAMIAIFDKDDELMLQCKSGEWWKDNIQRSRSNISLVIDDEWSLEQWRNYIRLMDANKSGEPGIWSRYGIRNSLPARRLYVEGMGPNPCVEQILRPRQFCNLDQVIVRSDDTKEDIFENIRLAAIVGTIQSAMTNFHGIDERFAEASNEERLLGVSIAGLMDNPLLNTGDEALLSELKNAVIETNKLWAKRLGINPSTSVTCIKPDGNTSVLYDTSPGMHGRYAKYYIRRIELQWGEPVANWAIEQGIPFALKFGQTWENPKTIVLEFPVKAPDGAAIQRERSAIEQLETWLSYKVAYTETNPSVTIMYRPDELDDIAVWLHDNQSEVVGLSFLPADDHTYQQAPYEEITEAEYNNLANAFPAVDLDAFWQYESNRDTTETLQTLACAGGSCLIG